MKKTLLCWLLCFAAAAAAEAQPIYRGIGTDVLYANDSDLADLAATGANSVRVDYHNPAADLQGEGEYRAWVDSSLAHLELLLPKLEALNLKAVISFSAPPAGRDIIAAPPVDRLFLPGYEWAQDLLVETWRRIAALGNGRPAVAAYQIMSEPAAPKAFMWKSLAARLIAAVRESGGIHPEQQPMILIPPLFGNGEQISSVLRPQLEGHYGISISFYYPWNYTHQGVYNQSVLMYPGCGTEIQALKRRPKRQPKKKRKNRRKRIPDRIAPAPRKKPINRCSPEGLVRSLAKVRRFSMVHQMPVVVTEYSVAGWAPGAAQYLQDAANLFDSYGWSSFYNVWRGDPVWSLEHDGTRNDWQRTDQKTDRALVIEQYFSKNEF